MERCRGFFGGQSAFTKWVRGFNVSDVTAYISFPERLLKAVNRVIASAFSVGGVCVSHFEKNVEQALWNRIHLLRWGQALGLLLSRGHSLFKV